MGIEASTSVLLSRQSLGCNKSCGAEQDGALELSESDGSQKRARNCFIDPGEALCAISNFISLVKQNQKHS